MGEDPYLTGEMVAAYVRGLQSTKAIATLKHFIGNEIEFHRRGSNSLIDGRALREVYMEPFRKGIEAGALAVMASYNQLNGEWAGQCKETCTNLLRQELKFPWVIMSDWNSTFDGMKIASSGLDLEMPNGAALRKEQARLLGSPEIDRMALNTLGTFIYAGFFEKGYAQPELESKRPLWEQTAARVNQSGIVLLKNSGILPLASEQTGKSILVLGNNALRDKLGGAGSGHVDGYNSKSYFQALSEGLKGAKVVYEAQPTDEQIKAADLVMLFSGFMLAKKDVEGEGRDRSFILPDEELIGRCVSLNTCTIVCVAAAGGGVRMDCAEQSAAILHTLYGGQTGAQALLEILTGKVNPSGKLPFTIEKRLEDSASFAVTQPQPNKARPYPSEPLQAVKDNFFANEDKSQFYLYDVNYSEGVFVGHRWYESKGIPVRFPFGYGLSYTTFSFSDLKLEKLGAQKVRVSFTMKNTGKNAGSEVAQLYVGDKVSSVPRPLQELKGFQKLLLQPGESKSVTMELGPEAFRFWNPATKNWVVEPGTFEIRVGASSADIRLKETIEL